LFTGIPLGYIKMRWNSGYFLHFFLNKYKTEVQYTFYSNLIIPSSLPFSNGLYRASIISTLDACILTDALYLEISGQCRDPTTYNPTLYNRTICCRDNQKSKNIEVQEIQNQTSLTAAIDGLSNRPSELWETSIPKIIVGVSLIRGRCPECSIANREFIPPSYILQA